MTKFHKHLLRDGVSGVAEWLNRGVLVLRIHTSHTTVQELPAHATWERNEFDGFNLLVVGYAEEAIMCRTGRIEVARNGKLVVTNDEGRVFALQRDMGFPIFPKQEASVEMVLK